MLKTASGRLAASAETAVCAAFGGFEHSGTEKAWMQLIRESERVRLHLEQMGDPNKFSFFLRCTMKIREGAGFF